jgi:FkbM family methyltransferase
MVKNPSELFLSLHAGKDTGPHYYTLPDGRAVTQLRNGAKIILELSDLSVTPHLMFDGIWEPEFTCVFRDLVKTAEVVFDVGANTGYYGLEASVMRPNARIHFFEPVPKLAKNIRESCSINGLTGRTKVVDRLVSGASGIPTAISVADDMLGSSTANSTLTGETSSLIIESISLDDYCEEIGAFQCDVAKIDVEGFEEKVLSGMEQVLTRNPHIQILVEYTLGDYAAEFLPTLKARFQSVSCIDKAGVEVPVNSFADIEKVADGDGFGMLVLREPSGFF